MTLFLPLLISLLSVTTSYAGELTEDYPILKKYTFEEKTSYTYVGFGLSPLTILGGKVAFSANLFQIHWIKNLFDIEILSVSYGISFGQAVPLAGNGLSTQSLLTPTTQSTNSNYFLFRSIPKIRLFNNISIGPVVGLEFINFPNISVQLNNNNSAFGNPQPFSSSGFIFGGCISETFHLDKGYILKVNQLVYQETYSYLFSNDNIAFYYTVDPTQVQPATVFLLEISFLY